MRPSPNLSTPIATTTSETPLATSRHAWRNAELPEAERPEVLLSSPYIRAKQTAEAICAAGGLAGGAKPTVIDERSVAGQLRQALKEMEARGELGGA